MNSHQTCQTCIHNQGGHCAPSTDELIVRLEVCADDLDWLAEKAAGEYKAYYSDRAARCRAWLADLREGHRVADEGIVADLIEFEAMAL